MAHGLESRVPYVNVKLLNFVNSISFKQRYKKNITKNILKNISQMTIFSRFHRKEKWSRNLPISRWLKNRNGFGRFIDYLNSQIVKY